MITLTAEELRYLYDKMTGVMDTNEYAIEDKVLSIELNRIREKYGIPEERAAAIAETIISKQIFPAQNTAIGLLALLTMLELNRIKISYTQSELAMLGNAIHAGAYQYDDICQWILEHKS